MPSAKGDNELERMLMRALWYQGTMVGVKCSY